MTGTHKLEYVNVRNALIKKYFKKNNNNKKINWSKQLLHIAFVTHFHRLVYF